MTWLPHGARTRSLLAIGLVWMAMPTASSVAQHPQVTLIQAPTCGDADDAGPWIEPGVAKLKEQLAGRFVEVYDAEALKKRLRETRGFHFVYYVGHDRRSVHTPNKSGLCLQPENRATSLESLLEAAAEGRNASGLVLVVDACRSADVDVRVAETLPVSVLSVSPYVVSSVSFFRERLSEAIRWARADPNCDGLITDEELFEAVTALLYQQLDLRDEAALPKLRRQAPSHIPLPLSTDPTRDCAVVRGRLARWAQDLRERAPDFAVALERQLALKPTGKHTRYDLPGVPADYFVVSSTDDTQADEVRRIATRGGLRRFPPAELCAADTVKPCDPETVEAAARFITFAEVYELRVAHGWVDVVRLRDGNLMATRTLEGLASAIPRRRRCLSGWWDPVDGRRHDIEVYMDRVPVGAEGPTGAAVVCPFERGQCFEAGPQSKLCGTVRGRER